MAKLHPIRAYRQQHNLNISEVAEKLKVTPGMVGHIERGIRGVSPEMAIKVEAQLGIPRAQLRPDLWA